MKERFGGSPITTSYELSMTQSSDRRKENGRSLSQQVADCIDEHYATMSYPNEERFFFIERVCFTPILFRMVFDSLLKSGISFDAIKNALPTENQIQHPRYEF